MKKELILTSLLSLSFLNLSCEKHQHKPDVAPAPAPATEKAHTEEHAHQALNGGILVEIGDHEAHLEFSHDEQRGEMRAWFYTAKVGEALKLEEAPQVFVDFGQGRQAVKMKPVSGALPDSAFSVLDERLKAHLHGTLNFKINGKVHNPALPGHHH